MYVYSVNHLSELIFEHIKLYKLFHVAGVFTVYTLFKSVHFHSFFLVPFYLLYFFFFFMLVEHV